MTKDQLKRVKEIFPEVPNDLLDYPTTSFYVYKHWCCMYNIDGEYTMNKWGTSHFYARSKNFEEFMNQLEKTRKEFDREQEKIKRERVARKLLSKILCTKLNKLGFTTEIKEDVRLEHLTINAFFPPPMLSGSIVQIDVWAGRIQAYYMYNIIYDRNEKHENFVEGAVERIAELHKNELKKIISLRSNQETLCEVDQ